jgi:site-specific DNA-cytosine methylase
MKILQLCCFSNLWPSIHQVTSIDIKTGTDVLTLSQDYGKDFDLICAAPPCDQFTKANQHNWEIYPDYFIKVAQKCFYICTRSNKFWFIENPPGRIEKLIPGLTQYRQITWQGLRTNKEYVIYSNFLILTNKFKRYGKPGSINNYSKERREAWQPDFISDINQTISTLNFNL